MIKTNNGSLAKDKSSLGLSSFMSTTFIWMFFALMVSALFSVWFASSPDLMAMLMTKTAEGKAALTASGWVVLFAPLGFVLLMSFGYESLSANMLTFLFIVYAAVNGISLSFILLFYTAGSVLGCFVTAALMFGIFAVYGYTTKKDLSSWGNILFMGLIGLIIALVFNAFLGSKLIDYIISIAGVIIFTALTAYDVQKIKSEYYDGKKGAIMAALNLYLDFINLFLYLLRLFGVKNK